MESITATTSREVIEGPCVKISLMVQTLHTEVTSTPPSYEIRDLPISRQMILFDGENLTTPFVDQLQGSTAAPGDTGQWIFSHDNRQAGLLLQQPVQIL